MKFHVFSVLKSRLEDWGISWGKFDGWHKSLEQKKQLMSQGPLPRGKCYSLKWDASLRTWLHLLRAAAEGHCQRLWERRPTSHSHLSGDPLQTGDHCSSCPDFSLERFLTLFSIFPTSTNMSCMLIACNKPSDLWTEYRPCFIYLQAMMCACTYCWALWQTLGTFTEPNLDLLACML